MLIRTSSRSSQRGAGIIELMVGVTVGLIAMAGVIGLLGGHLRGNTDLIRTTRLNNELRGAMDLIVRDLRRAGYWGNAASGVWYPNTPQLLTNPFYAVDTATTGEIGYSYDADSDGVMGSNENFRLSHSTATGTIEVQQLDATGALTGTTPLTDADLTNITVLTFQSLDRTATTTCLTAGAGPIAPTPPLVRIRQITVTLTGQLRTDPSVTRTLTEAVRLRNDSIEGSCPS